MGHKRRSSVAGARAEGEARGGSTRRSFLASAGLVGAAAALMPGAARAGWDAGSGRNELVDEDLWGRTVLCSVPADDVGGEGLRAIRDGRADAAAMERTAMAAPRAHASHPTLPVVYVANAVAQHDGLPRGSVTALRREREGMRVLATEPLALFATRPERLAASPDGAWMVVLAERGGAVSLLPLGTDGRPAEVSHALRFAGRGTHAAQQRSAPFDAVWHPSRAVVYVTDRGTDSVLVLAVEGTALQLIQRKALPAGFEPSHAAPGVGGRSLLVASASEAAVLPLRLDEASGAIAETEPAVSLPGDAGGPLLLDATDGTVLAASRGRGMASVSRIAWKAAGAEVGETTGLGEMWAVMQMAMAGRTLVVAGAPDVLALRRKGSFTEVRRLLNGCGAHGVSLLERA